jgi:2-phospho-L-lactate transferase/gluconeogenesis factor (CofD/UPF0052 family)
MVVKSDAAVPAFFPRAAEPRSTINVVLFSGGSGTRSITEALLRHHQISLKVLINAYDDGHSTGRLRRFIPGMLGPSDVRKNLSRLMPVAERGQKLLKEISDYRLPVNISRADALGMIGCVLARDYAPLPAALAAAFPQLVCWQEGRLCSFLRSFRDYFFEQEALGRKFDFTDCALGNLFFAGCYLEQGRDFNRAIRAFSAFCEVREDALLNVTLGEDLFLVAEKENGTILWNEADIVAAQDATKISELFLVDRDTYLSRIEGATEAPGEGWHDLLERAHREPSMNPAAAEALASADVIIYGPGTQHSSLFPSYMTAGVAEMIAANTKADKVFIGNIYRDFDSQGDDANDLARKLLGAMRRKGETRVEWTEIVSHFFLQSTDQPGGSEAKYVRFDRSRFAFPIETVRARDWEVEEGRHSGGVVLDELRQIVQSRVDVELAQVHHMVSIVIPVLNEARTIETVLKSLTALDFQELGLSKELILADGGSTDSTVEIARSVRNVKVCTLNPGSFGRGAAMRLGVSRARGNFIVFFPGDNEYRAEDLAEIVRSLLRPGCRVVFGTRNVKCADLSSKLKRIYQNNWKLYLTSKYGGMLLSIATLLLFNRYVTDILSTLKGYDAELLHSLALQSNGLEIETEIVAKLARRQEYMFEMPVDYKPRNRDQGKKISTMDGLRALTALVRLWVKR